MMKKTFKVVNVGIKAGFQGVLQTGRQAIIRSAAVFLIAGLLAQSVLFYPPRKTQAQTHSDSTIQVSVQSAPPTPFAFGSAETNFSSTIDSSLASLKDYLLAPALPAGFETAKQPTVFERTVSALGTTFGSLFDTAEPAADNAADSTKTTSSEAVSTNLPFGQLSGAVDFDFDGDSKADIGRWHASNTEWKIKKSSNGNYQVVTLGTSSSVIAPGDFDGDGKTDFTAFNSGTWTIKKSSDGTTVTPSLGSAGDKPVAGDYDGDGLSDLAVYRPSNNGWWIFYSQTGTFGSVGFGLAGDIPAQGKFDNDNKTDIAVFRPSTGVWHILGSTAGYYSAQWGNSSDMPVPADYTGDGRTDLAVYRITNGVWYILKSEDYATYLIQAWGNHGDQPVPADYDGDGKADYAVWRPTSGTWYIIKSGGGYDTQVLGVANDAAVPSAYLKQIGSYIYGYDFARVRLSPKNATGRTNLYSRNFSWGSGLVSLPGRAGLNAGFGISYNSLVWTKDTANNTMVFDADNSTVTPGFRMGFPTVEPVYYDTSTGKFAYLMVTPAGSRVEFRETGASNVYETADSNYTQLKINGTGTSPNDAADTLTLTLTETNGTNMLYEWKGGAYHCTKITDRNGNYIEVLYHPDGRLDKFIDTLGREVTVNYNTDNLPSMITQVWKDNNGQGSNVTRTYATFSYMTKQIYTNFSGSPTVIGPGNGHALKVLEKITFPTKSNGDGPHTVFEYNTWGQVFKIKNYAADNSPLNYIRTNLPADATNSESDCPRFTETYTQAENFNSGNEVTFKNTYMENVTYTLPDSTNQTGTRIEIKSPDGSGNADRLVTKIYSASSGWAEGLPVLTEDWADEGSGSLKKRWGWSDWAQDNESLAYIQNPRVVETKIGDTTNTKRTTIEYYLQPNTTIAEYGRVKKVQVYAANGTTVWKEIETTYNDNSAYLSRRMVNLPSLIKVSGYDQTAYQLKQVNYETFSYDQGDFTSDSTLEQNITSVIRHDANFSASFVTGRGNLTSRTRCDAINTSSSCVGGLTTEYKFNIAGGLAAEIAPVTGSTTTRIKFSYADDFNDTTTSRNTYAYPTRVYDPANNYTAVKFRFDTGANVRAQSPAPAGRTYGKTTSRIYDNFGRLEKESLWKEIQGTLQEYSYSRYEYPDEAVYSKVYSTLIDKDNSGVGSSGDEVLTESWSDGSGRILRTRTPMSWDSQGDTATWSGQVTEYNLLGQVKRQSVPAEVESDWDLAGDDAARGTWLWNSQEYDWKGRVTRSIPSDSTGSDGKDRLITYDGCGCAGGQVTTIQSESVPRHDQPNTNARRTQKIYADILGRTWKIEDLNWDGTVYSTNIVQFNGRDQVLSSTITEAATSTSQVTSMTYDGFGRLLTQHTPEMDTGTSRTYEYRADNQMTAMWDARGVKTILQYDNLGQLTMIDHESPQNSQLPVSPVIQYEYDNIGNRIEMTDGLGTVAYEYDSLSRLTKETRVFDSTLTDAPTLTNGLGIAYDYNLNNEVKTITYPNDIVVNYTMNKTGRVDSIAGTISGQAKTIVSDTDYRAWGVADKIEFGNTAYSEVTYNNRLLPATEKFFSPSSTSGFTTNINNEYSYYADGNIKLIDDKRITNSGVSRLNKYDQLGRRVTELSGKEALGTVQTNDFIKYAYHFTYDAFGNEKKSFTPTGYNYGANPGPTRNYNYTNNRNLGGTLNLPDGSWYGNLLAWQYDADGRALRSYSYEQLDSVYDEAGNAVHKESNYGNTKDDYWFDGNGKLTKAKVVTRDDSDVNNQPHLTIATTNRYVIQSSLLAEGISFVHTETKKYHDENDPPYETKWTKNTETSIYGLGRKLANNSKFESSTLQNISEILHFEYDAEFSSSEAQTQTTAGGNSSSVKSLSSRGMRIDGIAPNSGSTFSPERVWSGRSGSDLRCSTEGILLSCDEFDQYDIGTLMDILNSPLFDLPIERGRDYASGRDAAGNRHGLQRQTTYTIEEEPQDFEDVCSNGDCPDVVIVTAPARWLVAHTTFVSDGAPPPKRQQQDEPKVPRINNYTADQLTGLRNAFRELLDRLENEDCRELFTDWYDEYVGSLRPNDERGLALAEELVRDPSQVARNILFRFLDLGAVRTNPDGSHSVTGASTPSRDEVWINTNGPFLNRTIQVNGNNVTFNFGNRTTTLTQTQFAALLLLHELGHAYGKINGESRFFIPDASDAALNLQHTEAVINACFPELNQAATP